MSSFVSRCVEPAFFGLCMLFSCSGSSYAQQLPSYQVIFDDFKYEPEIYADSLSERDTTGRNKLFGSNKWVSRTNTPYVGRAWYYFNWTDKCTLDPDARIVVTDTYYGSVKLEAYPGFSRDYNCGASVPPQIEAGFTRRTGTWAVRIRLDELDGARKFTQTFWLSSSYKATYFSGFGMRAEWSEFNFEWQNWFNHGAWRSAKERAGIEGSNRDTYMANGIRMYEQDSDAVADDPARGGVSLRNPRKIDGTEDYAYNFACYTNRNGIVTNHTDPTHCMSLFTEDLNGQADQWVELMIQYDGQHVTFTALARTIGVGYMYMERTEYIGRRSLPLKTILDQHTSGPSVELTTHQTMEVDWFYYSPKTDLSIWNVINDVETFRLQDLSRINVNGVSLAAPSSKPWTVRLETPASDPGRRDEWVALPTQREHNKYHLQWSYRYKRSSTSGWSSWMPFEDGGFSYETPHFYKVELRVRVDDRSQHDNPEWAMTCRSYNFTTGTSGVCEGELSMTKSDI